MKKVGDYYPITTIVFPDGNKFDVILDKHIEQYTPPIKLDSLYSALGDSTRIAEGVFPCDLEAWLNGRRTLD